MVDVLFSIFMYVQGGEGDLLGGFLCELRTCIFSDR